jgi:hypothetical protein
MTDNYARGTLINQVGAVFVPVADQDQALGFYLDTLGLEKRADFTYGEDRRWMEVARRARRTPLPTRRLQSAHAPSKSCGVSLPGLSASNTMNRE